MYGSETQASKTEYVMHIVRNENNVTMDVLWCIRGAVTSMTQLGLILNLYSIEDICIYNRLR